MADLARLLWRAEKTRRPDDIQLPAKPPILSAKVTPAAINAAEKSHLDEYAELAALTGVKPPDASVKEFEAFLAEMDWPVFSLPAVVAYMDDKAAKESKDKCGWQWHALRAQDQRIGMNFGIGATRQSSFSVHREPQITQIASDHYNGGTKHVEAYQTHQGPQTYERLIGQHSVYDKTIPLHALRKVAAIDKRFAGRVALMVCDYALAPAIQHPDPFLMAVVENPKVANGTGRFVIDFWDEPGFGLEQQLKG